ncbi:MAG: hypothetical protein GXY08_08210, partial [Ruminococcus sp.]|nr:hypothetical protein [Ruminococcus sp.]
MNKTKTPILIAVVGVIATMIMIIAIAGGAKKNKNNDSKDSDIQPASFSAEEAEERMAELLDNVIVRNSTPSKGTVDYSDNSAANLPNIEVKYP